MGFRMRYEDPPEFPPCEGEDAEAVTGECSRCGSWPIEADENNENLSACCGSYLIVD